MKRKAADDGGDSLPRSRRPRSSGKSKETPSGSNASPLVFRDPACAFHQVSRDFLLKSRAEWKIFSEEELPGADVYYLPNLIDEETSARWKIELEQLETWYHPDLKVYGRTVTQSRSIAAYATTPDFSLKYSGQTVQMHYPYPVAVREIQNAVENALGLVKHSDPFSSQAIDSSDGKASAFNHVMLNRYDDGSMYIGRHSDSKENKVIASLSLGAPRTFIMTPRKGSPGKSVKWILENGSLVVMQGKTQENWKHEIPKEPKVKESRISLTFRQVEDVK